MLINNYTNYIRTNTYGKLYMLTLLGFDTMTDKWRLDSYCNEWVNFITFII